jgi:hypothetical protein
MDKSGDPGFNPFIELPHRPGRCHLGRLRHCWHLAANELAAMIDMLQDKACSVHYLEQALSWSMSIIAASFFR